MTQITHDRPWYCRDDIVDEYKTTIIDDATPLPMIKAVKALKALIVNLGVIALAAYAISRGGDPTILGAFGLATLATYNGVELGEYLALVQAASELHTESESDNPDSQE